MSESGRQPPSLNHTTVRVNKNKKTSEDVRKSLAAKDGDSSGSSDDSLTSNNLLVCFLNDLDDDEVEDVEVEEEESIVVASNRGAKILSQALKNNDDWQSDSDSDSDDSVVNKKLDLAERLPPIRSNNGLIRGNISRKKEHVIIPLRCSTEAGKESYSIPTPPDEQVQDHQDLVRDERVHQDQAASAFFQELSNIQTDARNQLKEAKSEAMRIVAIERSERQLLVDIGKLLSPIDPGSGSDTISSASSSGFSSATSTSSGSSALSTTSASSSPRGQRLNRTLLTPMNLAQLQVILNYLLNQIETLNEVNI